MTEPQNSRYGAAVCRRLKGSASNDTALSKCYNSIELLELHTYLFVLQSIMCPAPIGRRDFHLSWAKICPALL